MACYNRKCFRCCIVFKCFDQARNCSKQIKKLRTLFRFCILYFMILGHVKIEIRTTLWYAVSWKVTLPQIYWSSQTPWQFLSYYVSSTWGEQCNFTEQHYWVQLFPEYIIRWIFLWTSLPLTMILNQLYKTVCSKFQILTESVRNAADSWLSLKSPSIMFVCDTPCTFVQHRNNRCPNLTKEYWGSHNDCLETSSMDKEPTLVCESSLPYTELLKNLIGLIFNQY